MAWFLNIFRKNNKQEEDAAMKYLIVGLGNPGAEYQYTRHNIGFMVLEAMAARKDLEFGGVRYGHSCVFKHKGRQLIMLKPGTYMNLSGKAVRYHLKQHKIPIENLLIITDDLSLPFGRLRLRAKGSHAGHNGLKDIEALLETQTYARLKFGIGNEYAKGAQVDYVLSDFNSEENELLPKLIKRSCEIILGFATIGVNRTMGEFNKKAMIVKKEEKAEGETKDKEEKA